MPQIVRLCGVRNESKDVDTYFAHDSPWWVCSTPHTAIPGTPYRDLRHPLPRFAPPPTANPDTTYRDSRCPLPRFPTPHTAIPSTPYRDSTQPLPRFPAPPTAIPDTCVHNNGVWPGAWRTWGSSTSTRPQVQRTRSPLIRPWARTLPKEQRVLPARVSSAEVAADVRVTRRRGRSMPLVSPAARHAAPGSRSLSDANGDPKAMPMSQSNDITRSRPPKRCPLYGPQEHTPHPGASVLRSLIEQLEGALQHARTLLDPDSWACDHGDDDVLEYPPGHGTPQPDRSLRRPERGPVRSPRDTTCEDGGAAHPGLRAVGPSCDTARSKPDVVDTAVGAASPTLWAAAERIAVPRPGTAAASDHRAPQPLPDSPAEVPAPDGLLEAVPATPSVPSLPPSEPRAPTPEPTEPVALHHVGPVKGPYRGCMHRARNTVAPGDLDGASHVVEQPPSPAFQFDTPELPSDTASAELQDLPWASSVCLREDSGPGELPAPLKRHSTSTVTVAAAAAALQAGARWVRRASGSVASSRRSSSVPSVPSEIPSSCSSLTDGMFKAMSLVSQVTFRMSNKPLRSSIRSLKDVTWYNMILTGEFEAFANMVEENPAMLKERDPTGATPLHLLLLHRSEESDDIVRAIIDSYPELCKVQYTGEQYTGESLLHIAIIKQAPELVQFLATTCPELLRYRATGQFFSPGTKCYYGELPLSFAVCTNQPEMVRILLNAGADPTWTDHFGGNNAAHMAVLHDHQDMYDLLISEWRARKDAHQWAEPDVCITERPNRKGQRCLALAAAKASAEMFDHALTATGEVIWQHGKTTFTLYPVDGLDDGPHSAMAYIIGKGRHELLNLPRIRRLLQSKWETFGRRSLWTRLLKHLVLLAAFQVGITLPRASIDWGSPAGPLAGLGFFGLLRVACEAVVVGHTLLKLVIEGKEMRSQGLRNYFGVGGAMMLENCVSLVEVAAVLCALTARLVHADVFAENVATALASFCCWFYLLFFCLGFRLTGPFVVIAFTMLHTDIPAFLLVAFSFLGAFASSLYILSAKVGLGPLMFNIQACMDPFLASFEESHFQDVIDTWPRLARSVITTYLIMVVLVLMNLLLARMGDTYNRISEQAELEWLLQRARVVCGMENEMTEDARAEIRDKFLVLDWSGRLCFQVAEVDDNFWRHPKHASDSSRPSTPASLA